MDRVSATNAVLQRRWTRPALAAALCLLAATGSAHAIAPDKDGWYHTGSGIRTKSVAFIDVNVYEIHHYMKVLPAAKTKPAVIEADVDKKIAFKMMRDVDSEKIQDAFRDGFDKNGYKVAANVAKFVGAVSGDELKKGAWVSIVYTSATKTTTINVGGGGSASVTGVDFMRAVWSIWLGKFDQPALGLAMIKDL
jgi:hypothetical protein